MSLLSKIGKSEKRNPENENQKTEVAKTTPPPDPCPVCDCPHWWLDIYAGPLGPWRCLSCTPPPLESLAAEWFDCRDQLTRSNAIREAVDDVEAFGGEFDTIALVDDWGELWDVMTRREDRRGTCPPGQTLADLVEGLPMKLSN